MANGHAAELVIVATDGDRSSEPIADNRRRRLHRRSARGHRRRRVDIAVHSYKDLPTAQDPRFVIAAIPPREDAA